MNETIFYFFYNFAHQSIFLDYIFIFFAVYFPFMVVMLAGLFLLFHHEVLQAESPFQVFLEKKKEILIVFFSAFSSYFISVIIKNIFHTLRPFLAFDNVLPLFKESGFAFLSSHTAFFSALAFSVLFIHKKAGYVFIFFALLIGMARVVSGVHFPVDILGGFALGALVALFFKNFIKIN